METTTTMEGFVSIRRNCLLCNSPELYNQKNNYLSEISEQLISCCNAYLPVEKIGSVTLVLPALNGPTFCKVCFENTMKLSYLHERLEEIQTQINQLVSQMVEKIITDRRNYELIGMSNNHPAEYNIESALTSLPGSLITAPDVTYSIQPEMVNNLIADAKQYYCGICGELFYSEAELNIHSVSHQTSTDLIVTGYMTERRPDEHFNCDVCGKAFQTHQFLQNHKVLHVTDSISVSNECSTSSVEIQPITQTDIPPSGAGKAKKVYECKVCGEVFKKPSNFTIHMMSHDDEIAFKCQTCDKSFDNDSELKKHKCGKQRKKVKMTSPGDPLSIEKHNTDSNSTESSSGNSGSQQTRVYECEVCGEIFKKPSNYTVHMMEHSDNSEEKLSFNCKTCDKTFNNFGEMKSHKCSQQDDSLDMDTNSTINSIQEHNNMELRDINNPSCILDENEDSEQTCIVQTSDGLNVLQVKSEEIEIEHPGLIMKIEVEDWSKMEANG